MIVLTPQAPGEPSGSWDSIHVFEAAERGRQAHYKLTSTIMLHMVDRSISTRSSKDEVVKSKVGLEKNEQNDAKRDGEVTLSGSMTRQTEQDYQLQDQSSHITNTGKMIEEMEIKMRNLLQEVCCIALQEGTLILIAPRVAIGILWQDPRRCLRLALSRRPRKGTETAGTTEGACRLHQAVTSRIEERTVVVYLQNCTNQTCADTSWPSPDTLPRGLVSLMSPWDTLCVAFRLK